MLVDKPASNVMIVEAVTSLRPEVSVEVQIAGSTVEASSPQRHSTLLVDKVIYGDGGPH